MARMLIISIVVIILTAIVALPVLGAGNPASGGLSANVADVLVQVVLSALGAERCEAAASTLTTGMTFIVELPDCWLLAR